MQSTTLTSSSSSPAAVTGIIGDDLSRASPGKPRSWSAAGYLHSEARASAAISGAAMKTRSRLIIELTRAPKENDERNDRHSWYPLGTVPHGVQLGHRRDRTAPCEENTGIEINAVIAGGCTVSRIRHAREVELNASWCYDWGQKLGDLMQEKFGVPYTGPGSPMGGGNKGMALGVATPLGMEEKALAVIEQEMQEVTGPRLPAAGPLGKKCRRRNLGIPGQYGPSP